MHTHTHTHTHREAAEDATLAHKTERARAEELQQALDQRDQEPQHSHHQLQEAQQAVRELQQQLNASGRCICVYTVPLMFSTP